ncbi:MAG: hypothetical protein RIS70_4096, partial [Planctomycetota bacterium]
LAAGFIGWRIIRSQLSAVPDFYATAMATTHSGAIDPSGELAAQQLEQRAEAARDAIQHDAAWELALTEAEVNVWLARELPQQFPEMAASSLRDPRVKIDSDGVWLGVSYNDANWQTVLSLRLKLALGAQRNTIDCRLAAARAGALPLPLQRVIDPVRQEAARNHWPVTWSESDGVSLASIALPNQFPAIGPHEFTLATIDFTSGAVVLRGSAAPSSSPSTLRSQNGN